MCEAKTFLLFRKTMSYPVLLMSFLLANIFYVLVMIDGRRRCEWLVRNSVSSRQPSQSAVKMIFFCKDEFNEHKTDYDDEMCSNFYGNNQRGCSRSSIFVNDVTNFHRFEFLPCETQHGSIFENGKHFWEEKEFRKKFNEILWKSIKLSRLRKSFLCRIFPSSLKAQNSFVSISCNIENIVVDLKSYRSHNWNKPAMMFLSEFIALQESGE